MQILKRKGFISFIAGFFFLTSCAPGFISNSSIALNSSENTPTTIPTPAPTNTELGICSTLNFNEITWPVSLLNIERKAMALSLNITGSFEGNAGWGNITNNFDGQGMSLGLNQQNFGQGSLQPLLIDALQNHLDVAKANFSTANLNLLKQMLNAYSQSSVTSFATNDEDELFPDKAVLSPLDINDGFVSVLSTKTDASVAWAKANLYLTNGTTFKTDWKNSFSALAVTPAYRTIQLNAALAMFKKAKGYFTTFKFHELRSLLTMYDFVVQNGGFNSTHSQQFVDYDKANPNATETQRLLKLLQIRVLSVLDAYKADVTARKSAIINGIGLVHGANRNLPKQYCYTSGEALN